MQKKDPKLVAQQLNNLRLEHQNEEMNRQTLCSLIEKILPRDNRTITVCVKLGIIIRVKHGCYKFPEKPIHQKKIETFQSTVTQKPESKDEAVEAAIRLLEKSDFVVNYDPIIRNGVRLSEALKVAKKYGYTIIKN